MAILIIKKEDLPPISGSSQSYPIRYRLVSEDRSKFSYWSPIFNIPVQKNYSASEIPVSNAGTIVSSVWNIVADVNSYDVWIRWGKPGETGDWFFLQTTNNNSINTIIPSEFYNGGVLVSSTPNVFSIRVYEATYSIAIYPAPPKSQYPAFLLYEKLNQFNITNKQLTSNVATLTTLTNHTIQIGDSVTITGVDATFNGVYVVIAITSNTLNYAKTAGDISFTAVSPAGSVSYTMI